MPGKHSSEYTFLLFIRDVSVGDECFIYWIRCESLKKKIISKFATNVQILNFQQIAVTIRIIFTVNNFTNCFSIPATIQTQSAQMKFLILIYIQ